MSKRSLGSSLSIVLLWAALISPMQTSAQAMAQETPSPASGPFAGARFKQIPGGDGVPLNVVEKGDASKPGILLIHGFRQSYLSWSLQFDSALAENCHLVAFDLRGHGNSGVPWQAEAYDNPKPWADDVASVIRASGLKNPLVVAWSFGGNVLMNFIRNYPDAKLAGMVLVDTGAGMLIPPPQPANAPLRPTQLADLAINLVSVNATNDLLFSKNLDPALKAQFAGAAMRVSPFVDRGIVKLSSTSNTDLLPRLTAPQSAVTLVFGGRDPIIPATMMNNIKQLFKGARMLDFPEAGHAPFLDEAMRFNTLLETHCKPAAH